MIQYLHDLTWEYGYVKFWLLY